jgi:hypothetical protein
MRKEVEQEEIKMIKLLEGTCLTLRPKNRDGFTCTSLLNDRDLMMTKRNE